MSAYTKDKLAIAKQFFESVIVQVVSLNADTLSLQANRSGT